MPESPEPAGGDLARQLRAELALVAADAQAARTPASGMADITALLRRGTDD